MCLARAGSVIIRTNLELAKWLQLHDSSSAPSYILSEMGEALAHEQPGVRKRRDTEPFFYEIRKFE